MTALRGPVQANEERKGSDIDLVLVLQLGDFEHLAVDPDLRRFTQMPEAHAGRGHQHVGVDRRNEWIAQDQVAVHRRPDEKHRPDNSPDPLPRSTGGNHQFHAGLFR